MIDNFDTLRNILEFPTKDVFYVISIIQRPKDFAEGFTERRYKEHFVKHYLCSM